MSASGGTLVRVEHAVAHEIRRSHIRDASSTGVHEAPGKPVVRQNPPYPGRDGGGIGAVHPAAGVPHDLGQRTDPAAHDGCSQCHRLERRVPEPLELGRV